MSLQIFNCVTPPNLSTILVAHDQYSHEQKSNTNKIDVVVRTLLKDDLECKVQNDLKAAEHVGQRWTDESVKMKKEKNM